MSRRKSNGRFPVNSSVCVFCSSSQEDENLFGKLMSKDGLTAHYFCMLFSSGLSQNGKSEKHGILGFMPDDIMKEVKRASRLRCFYCKTPGATIGCVVGNCKKTFHLGCGRKNSTLHLFYDTFCSYCPIHRLQQDVPGCDDPNLMCPICMNHVEGVASSVTLRAPCCKTNWYHRDCLQSYATSAGLYFFKCPTCNNKDGFQQEMLMYGIYIPDQDASWETQPQAYQELLERHNSCDAKVCKCAEGRKHNIEGSKWEVTLCDYCGSQGSHKACQFLVKRGQREICPDCKQLDDEGKRKKKLLKSPPSKRRSAELMKLESPGASKQGSEYPGSTDSPKKKGLPCQQNQHRPYKNKLSSPPQARSTSRSETITSLSLGKKRHSIASVSKDAPATKKRRSAAAESSTSTKPATSDMSKDISNNRMMNKEKKTHNGSMKKLSLDSPPVVLKRKYEKHKHKSLEMDGKQQTLMSWLSQGRAQVSTKPSSTVTSEPTPGTSNAEPLRASPRKHEKKKPFVMEWKGKQFLIKSPRVLLRKNKKVGKLKPINLEIDMNAWKEGSVQSWEMDLLTSIDTDVRVTRTMFSSDNTLTDKLIAESAEQVNARPSRKCTLNEGPCRKSIHTDQTSQSEQTAKHNRTNRKEKHFCRSELNGLKLTADETQLLFGKNDQKAKLKTRRASEITLPLCRLKQSPSKLDKVKSSVTDLQTEAELTPSGKKEFCFRNATYTDFVKSATRSSPRLNTGKSLDFDDGCRLKASTRSLVNADNLKRRHTLSLVLNKTPKFVGGENSGSDESDIKSSSARSMPTHSIVENNEHQIKGNPATPHDKTQKISTPKNSPMKGVPLHKVKLKEKSPEKSPWKVGSPRRDVIKEQKDEQLNNIQSLTPTRLPEESREVRALRSAQKESTLQAPCSPRLDKTQSAQVLTTQNVQANQDKYLKLLNYSASKHFKAKDRTENKVSSTCAEMVDTSPSDANTLLLWKCAGTRQILNEESKVVTRARTSSPEKAQQVRMQGGSENRCPNLPSGEKTRFEKNLTMNNSEYNISLKQLSKNLSLIDSEDNMSLTQLQSVLKNEVGRYVEQHKLKANTSSPSRNGLRPRSGHHSPRSDHLEKNKLADHRVQEALKRRASCSSGIYDQDLMLEYYKMPTEVSRTQTQHVNSPKSVSSSSTSETDVIEIQV